VVPICSHQPGRCTAEHLHDAHISGTLRLPWLPVLANVPPRSIRRKAACDKLLQTVEMHPEWPVHRDFFNHPPARLPSRKPIWSDMTPVDVTSRWRADWQSSSVSNSYLISDPTTRPAGFDLRRSTWSVVTAESVSYWPGPLCSKPSQMEHGRIGHVSV